MNRCKPPHRGCTPAKWVHWLSSNSVKVPVGIVTDRDLTVRVLAEALDPVETPVAQVMTPLTKNVHEKTSIEDALALMRSGSFRRLPVVDSGGKLVGLLSLDDILSLLTEEFQEIGQLLEREAPSSLAEG